MMAGIYGFGGGYSESARRKAAGLNDDGSFMPGYSATQGGIADPRGNLVNSRDPFTAGYKQQPLSALLNGAAGFGGAQRAQQYQALPYQIPEGIGSRAQTMPLIGGAQQQAPGLGMVSAQGPRVQAGQGLASPQSSFAMTLADLLRNYYA
jgi:hypothetical protein